MSAPTACVLLLGACGAGPLPQPAESPAAAPVPTQSDLDVLGRTDTWQFGSQCDDTTCRPVLRGPSGDVVLPIDPADPPWAIDGVELVALTAVDLDGDGTPELRADWRSVGVPRAAVGSWVRVLTTVVDMASSAVRLHVETGHYGGASEEHCAGSIAFSPTGVMLEQQCQLKACIVGGATPEECAGGPVAQTRHIDWVVR